MNKIPFLKSTFDNREEKAIINCIRSGWTVTGPVTKQFEQAFAKYVGSKYAVFVDSGTSALSLSLALAIKNGYYKKYVTIPSLTFCSDAEIVYHSGLDIKYADINRKTLCVDKQYNRRNCIPVNFAGVLAKCDGKIIDSCHRIMRNDVKGSDSLWCYSFYATKALNTIQGGMIATNDRYYYELLIMARDHGTTKGTKQRYQGKDPMYDIEFPGYRMKADDVKASIGLVQLKKLDQMNKKRDKIVDRYNKNLGYNRTGNYLYTVFVDDRVKFIKMMHDKGIQTSVHFPPIHKFTAYKQDIKLPVTDWVCDRIVSLPLFPQLTMDQVDYVSEQILNSKLLIKL